MDWNLILDTNGVYENQNISKKIFWGFETQTDYLIQVRIEYTILINKKKIIC